jgi:hypothetical protein
MLKRRPIAPFASGETDGKGKGIMMMTFQSRVWSLYLAFGAVLVLAGCQKLEAPPSPPPEASASEQERNTACWRWASAQAEREFARAHPDPGVLYGRPIALRERFDRFDAEKRRQRLYEQCKASERPAQEQRVSE